MEDRELLREYVEEGSERAFAELVRRHLGLVYGSARRVVGAGPGAEDVAQTVFIELARKAGSVRDGNALPGWLYRAAYREAVSLLRKERRRQRREEEAMKLNAATEVEAWQRLAPLLDEGMQRLNTVEQNALVLRFFEGKSLRETGEALALSEAAAGKRVERALEKLRVYFGRQGVVVPAAVMATAITAQAGTTLPAGLAESVTGASLAQAGAGSASLLAQAKGWAGAVVVAGLMFAPAAWEWQRNGELQAEVRGWEAPPATAAATWTADVTEKMVPLSDADLEAELQKARALWGKNSPEMMFQWEAYLNENAGAGDMPKIMARVEQVVDSYIRRDLWQDALHYWLKVDPASAEAYVLTLPPGTKRDGALCAVVAETAQHDVNAAAALAMEINGWSARNTALKTVIGTVAQKDPAAALALVPNGTGMHDQAALVGDIFGAWAETSPVVAISQIASLPSAEQRMAADQALIDHWGLKNLATAQMWLAGMTDEAERMQATDYLVGQWAEQDNTAALAWVEQLPDGPAKLQAQRQLIGKWAGKDPAAALTYLKGLPNLSEQGELMGKLLETWSGKDPTTAGEFLATVPDNVVPPYLGDNIWMNWAQKDPSEMATNALKVTNSDAQEAMLKIGVQNWATNDEAAARAFIKQIPAGDAQDAAADGLLEYLLEEKDNLKAAEELANSMPTADTKESMLEEVMDRRVADHPDDAPNWMGAMPAGPMRDEAVTQYVWMKREKNPEQAAQWVGLIGDPKESNHYIEQIAKSWLAKDPAAASAWLAGTTLPEARKQKLLNKLQEAP